MFDLFLSNVLLKTFQMWIISNNLNFHLHLLCFIYYNFTRSEKYVQLFRDKYKLLKKRRCSDFIFIKNVLSRHVSVRVTINYFVYITYETTVLIFKVTKCNGKLLKHCTRWFWTISIKITQYKYSYFDCRQYFF